MNKFLLLLGVAVLISCGPSQSKEGKPEPLKMDRQTKIRMNQYMVKGVKLYTQHCSACHQDSGEGLASLYPPLKDSDYLLEDLPRAACVIKNGLVESIKVNGKPYNQMMPGVPRLTPLEVAEILTYITNSWGNQVGLTGVREVEKWLKDCE